MAQVLSKDEILDAVATQYRNDRQFLEELNSLTWSLKVRLRSTLKPKQDESRMD